jgi:predicted dehydrogenase
VTQPVRVAVIGAGGIAQVAHLPVLRRMTGVEIVALCDNDLSKTQALAARFGIPNSYDDIEEVLRYSGADLAVICTPNHLHESHAVAALSAGLHVVCERPLSLTSAGVERVLATAEKAGRRVLVGMNHRFRSDVQAVRSFLGSGELGSLDAIHAGWYVFQPAKQMTPWRLRRQEAGGGALLDLGLPLLDLGLWLAGWPVVRRVSAHLVRHPGEEVETMGSALLTLEGGALLSLDVSFRHFGEGERFWFDVVGTRGSAGISPLRVFKEFHGSPTDVTPTGASGRETMFTQSYRAEWTYVLAVIRGEVNAPAPRDQIVLHQVLAAVYRSADEGCDVSL